MHRRTYLWLVGFFLIPPLTAEQNLNLQSLLRLDLLSPRQSLWPLWQGVPLLDRPPWAAWMARLVTPADLPFYFNALFARLPLLVLCGLLLWKEKHLKNRVPAATTFLFCLSLYYAPSVDSWIAPLMYWLHKELAFVVYPGAKIFSPRLYRSALPLFAITLFDGLQWPLLVLFGLFLCLAVARVATGWGEALHRPWRLRKALKVSLGAASLALAIHIAVAIIWPPWWDFFKRYKLGLRSFSWLEGSTSAALPALWILLGVLPLFLWMLLLDTPTSAPYRRGRLRFGFPFLYMGSLLLSFLSFWNTPGLRTIPESLPLLAALIALGVHGIGHPNRDRSGAPQSLPRKDRHLVHVSYHLFMCLWFVHSFRQMQLVWLPLVRFEAEHALPDPLPVWGVQDPTVSNVMQNRDILWLTRGDPRVTPEMTPVILTTRRSARECLKRGWDRVWRDGKFTLCTKQK